MTFKKVIVIIVINHSVDDGHEPLRVFDSQVDHGFIFHTVILNTE